MMAALGFLLRGVRRGLWWLLQGLVVVGAVVTLFIALTPQGRAGFHTGLLVLEVLDFPVKPQGWFVGEPLRHEAHYASAEGTAVADVYRPAEGGRHAAVVLFLGANAAGREDGDVVNLGKALARAGFVAMFHWSPTMALQANIEAAEAGNLVRAFEYLSEREYVDAERAGLGGFCVGASFALVAAADPRIRDRVYFVNAFGPYFDAEELLLQAASRSVVYAGRRTAWEPDGLTLRVLANELIEGLEDSRDAAALTRVYLEGGSLGPGEWAGLSAQGRAVSRLLDGVSGREEAELLYAGLPAGFRGELAGVSPSSYVGDIRARLLVMHDRNDRLVPAAESRRLAAAARGLGGEVRYTEVSAFDHVRPSGGLEAMLGEGVRLYRHLYEIVRVAQ